MSRERPRLAAFAHSGYGRERAQQLLDPAPDGGVHGPFATKGDLLRAVRTLAATRPRVVYLVDVGDSTAVLAVVARVLRMRVIVDTGDVAYELAKSVGRARLGLAAVWLGERTILLCAHEVVVRGRAHLDLVKRPATFVPDVAPATARPLPADASRWRTGLPEDVFVAGLVGSLNHARRLGTVYGWDLVEALPNTPPTVRALIIGDGDGLELLQKRADELGVAGRVEFAGRVPQAEVAELLAAMDVGISTQTNDLVGAVRTTGKLPLYLQCGIPVLASDVGEARRLLGPLGWTVRYDGVVDRAYPDRLAEKLSEWAAEPNGRDERRATALELARTEFDPNEMRERLRAVVARVAAG